jgi:hypothetical protein
MFAITIIANINHRFRFRKFDEVLDKSNPPFYRWFKGGIMNTCFNCLDVHVQQGRGDQEALIWDSPVSVRSHIHSLTRN